MNKRKIGSFAEEKAVKFLESQNYIILKKNYHTRFGEIDIIAKNGNTIVFFEVKYRKNDFFGLPLEAISKRKIESICKTARIYLNTNIDTDSRFDVISITGDKIEHIINAFDYCYHF